jgi:hypothetical protein
MNRPQSLSSSGVHGNTKAALADITIRPGSLQILKKSADPFGTDTGLEL